MLQQMMATSGLEIHAFVAIIASTIAGEMLSVSHR
jgi:hypothetical protein